MADFPLLPLPSPQIRSLPKGRQVPRKPPRTLAWERQSKRLGPVFQRLADVFDADRDPITLRDDPKGLASERVLVFELAGSVDDFEAATRRIPGLEYLAEHETEFEPDDDFWIVDTRKGKKGQPRPDKPVGGRVYMAMPDVTALRRLLSLWKRYEKGLPSEKPFGRWFSLFGQLKELRPWGSQDRIPEDVVAGFQQDLAQGPRESIQAEVELWPYRAAARRESAWKVLENIVDQAGGSVIYRASIPDVAYEAALVELPRQEIERLVQHEEVHLAVCDEIMFVRPQSSLSSDWLSRDSSVGERVEGPPPSPDEPPIAALLDGVPVQRHDLLDERVVIDDPDGLEELSLVSERTHGTAMASLIVHGDRNLRELPLRRLLHLHPVLYAPGRGQGEQFQPHRLLIDTIYQAILRIKQGAHGVSPTAPDVFLINLSLGDERRPYAGQISPWARLLDYLAHRYDILFLVSAGNIRDPLPIPGYSSLTDFEEASSASRETAVLGALGKQRSKRTLFSPAEGLNVVTVGAGHDEADGAPRYTGSSVDPYESALLPNVSSAMGLGHRKAVKPEILMPGGREHVLLLPRDKQLSIKPAEPGSAFGIKVAAPDRAGRLNLEGHQSGTSVATALATRSTHRLFEALMDPDNGAVLADADPRYYAVVVKALLVHRARWDEDIASKLREMYGPHGRGQHVARDDNVARVVGYGGPCVEESMTCAFNRATLVGYGQLRAKQMATCRLPLPPSLDRLDVPRSLTVTLAWFSPVNVRHLSYRMAKLEVEGDFKNEIGTERAKAQPAYNSIPRGTLFHERYEGEKAVAFVGDGLLSLRVRCKEQAGKLDEPIRYGLAVTVEADEGIPVYQEIRDRLVIRPRA